MPLVSTAGIVGAGARGRHAASGAFNVIGIEHAEAIVAGAEAAGAAGHPAAQRELRRPITARWSRSAARCCAAAAAATVPVAVHLDHATGAELVCEAVGLGFGSVMYDASALPYAANVAATAAIAAWCHERGVWVEAELGEVGGKDGVHAAGARTQPGEAADLRRRDRSRRAGGRGGQLARDGQQGRGARPRSGRADPRGGAGTAGPARLVWRARRRAPRRGAGPGSPRST